MVAPSVRTPSRELKAPWWRTATRSSSGQRCRARALSRCCSEVLVESGYFTTALSLASRAGSPLVGVSVRGPDRGNDTKIDVSMSSPYVIVLTDAEDRRDRRAVAPGRGHGAAVAAPPRPRDP